MTTITDRVLDDAWEQRRPENQVSHAFYVFVTACDELRRVLTAEDTTRLAAMEERDTNDIELAIARVKSARSAALYRLAVNEVAADIVAIFS